MQFSNAFHTDEGTGEGGPEAGRHKWPPKVPAAGGESQWQEMGRGRGWGEESGRRKRLVNKGQKSAETPSSVILGARRPLRFYAGDGDSQEPRYKNGILDTSRTA